MAKIIKILKALPSHKEMFIKKKTEAGIVNDNQKFEDYENEQTENINKIIEGKKVTTYENPINDSEGLEVIKVYLSNANKHIKAGLSQKDALRAAYKETKGITPQIIKKYTNSITYANKL